MPVSKYDSSRIIEHAIDSHRKGKNVRASLRQQFPGITDYLIRKAIEDAKILLAFRQVLKRKNDDL